MSYDLSVVIPTYNKAAHLRRNLLSLSVQTFAHDCFEALVVDDGSTDATRRVVEEARQQYDYAIRYFFLNRPWPAASALPVNYGIVRAAAPVIIHAGADTILAKDALALLHDYIHGSDGDLMVFGRCYHVHSHMANALLDHVPWTQDIHVLESIFCQEYHHSPYWRVPMLSALPKIWYERLHGFDEGFEERWPDDDDLWVRLEASGVTALNPPDVWAAHQYHPSVDPACGDGCRCPLSQTSKTHPGPNLKYNGTPEAIVRNPEHWGQFADAYEA
jgi:glycosyltransferase involved in cell wall biosynthesis